MCSQDCWDALEGGGSSSLPEELGEVMLLPGALTISLGLVAQLAGVRALLPLVPDVQMRLKLLPALTPAPPPPAESQAVSRVLKWLNDLFACLLAELSVGVQPLPYVILHSMRNQTEVAILTPFIHTSYFYTDRCKICKV